MECCLLVTKIAKNNQQLNFGIKIERETVGFYYTETKVIAFSKCTFIYMFLIREIIGVGIVQVLCLF